MQKLILKHFLSPGDVLVLTATIRDLHLTYPGQYLTDVRTSCDGLWENNPYITKIKDSDSEAKVLAMEYPLIHESNEGAHHFLHGFIRFLNEKLDLKIKPTQFRPEIHLSQSEKEWYSQVHEILKKDVPYWIVNAGHKSDFTCKMWEFTRFQKIVDTFPEITFVQVGGSESSHSHAPLIGHNVVNLVGKTDMRQMCRLMYHAAGCITGVSFPMHLAAAVETKPCYARKHRPCVVIAGGREPSVWEAYTTHAYLHNCGTLPCCDSACWKSRVVALPDKDEKNNCLCERPTTTASGQIIPKCLDMITAEHAIEKIHDYLREYDYYRNWDLKEDGTVK